MNANHGGLARSLIRLYPRIWRERYGDEFMEVIGGRPLTTAAVIDIVAGAIDARLSSTARVARQHSGEGVVVIDSLKRSCARRSFPFSVRDGLIGAGVFIVATALFAGLGTMLRQQGRADLAQYVHAMSLFASMTVSMPFTFLKGQPWRAQAVIVGGTLVLLVLIAVV